MLSSRGARVALLLFCASAARALPSQHGAAAHVLRSRQGSSEADCDEGCQNDEERSTIALRYCTHEGTPSAQRASGSMSEHDFQKIAPSLRSSCFGGFAEGNEPRPPAPPHIFPASCGLGDSPKRIAFMHVSKTAGGTMSATMKNVSLNWTEIHVTNAYQAAADDFDIYILSTREPVGRVASSFNWVHTDGGGMWQNPVSGVEVNEVLDARLEEDPLGVSVTRVPLGHEPMSLSGSGVGNEVSKCFPQLPGGFNAWAEALDSSDACGQIARRSLHEPSAGVAALSKGYEYYFGTFGAADKMRLPGKQVFHVSMENFDADFAAMWQWLCFEEAPPTVDVHDALNDERAQARHDDTTLSDAGLGLLQKHLTSDYYYMEVLLDLSQNNLTAPAVR